ncbi:hypothetical protein ThrDRAFT_04657, partial [Frankia casuarinae]
MTLTHPTETPTSLMTGHPVRLARPGETDDRESRPARDTTTTITRT